ncbi:DUF6588 family protein [Flavobacterium rhizosphaerae]|uniref:DUF6588 family protein n=1 Tax=Flavobacterium rhizosphaerae TaxID=3163298 RepID=A0ABW8Z0R6_9FLAO
MRKIVTKVVVAAGLLCTGKVVAQSVPVEDFGHLLNDALFFSDKYVTPATDAAIYQSVSGWVNSNKNTDLWDVSFGLHTNIFFTPKSDRTLTIYNSDFTFFQLEQGTQATVPTALGDKKQVYLTGMLGDDEVRLETPQGINMETVAYPYLQGSLGLGFGTALVIKYSPEVKLKKSKYQVYGLGLQHSISQYIKPLKNRNIYLSLLAAFSKEDVWFNFLDVQTDYGTLGISQINGLVDTWQFQLTASKVYGNWEPLATFMVTTSEVKYKVGGERGSIEDVIPVQQVVNDGLKEIYKTRVNYIGEAGVTFNKGNFNVQGILAFGKFVNTNVSVHYLIN